MKTRANGLISSTTGRFVLGLCLLLPLLMGGCPEFRDDVTSVFETATRSAILGTEDEWTIGYTVRGSVIDATIGFIFDQLRSNRP